MRAPPEHVAEHPVAAPRLPPLRMQSAAELLRAISSKNLRGGVKHGGGARQNAGGVLPADGFCVLGLTSCGLVAEAGRSAILGLAKLNPLFSRFPE